MSPADTADGTDKRNGGRGPWARALPRPTAIDWPPLPPVPRPTPPPAYLGPEPPIIVGDANLITPPLSAAVPDPVPAPSAQTHGEGSQPASPALVPVRVARIPLRIRTVRRPVAVPSRADNQVWQPRFAYLAAAVIAACFALVAAPLWVVLYRLVGTEEFALEQIVPLGMMLLGGFLTAVTAWVVIVEMRARVRVVDTMSRTGEHESPDAAGASVFAGLLRPFIQIPTQVGLLAVAFSLFVGATILSL